MRPYFAPGHFGVRLPPYSLCFRGLDTWTGKTAKEFGAEGGRRRAANLTPEQRSEIASQAAVAKWEAQGKLRYPRATHDGTLTIGELKIPVFVLEDGTRLMSRAGFVKAIGRKGKVKGGDRFDGEFGESKIPVFLAAENLKPFISNELVENSRPVFFRPVKGPGKLIGFRAELIPQVCHVLHGCQGSEAPDAVDTTVPARVLP
jgi:hypothetical protein